MSTEQFMQERQTEEYRELNRSKEHKEEFMAMLAKRRGDASKREKILEALYSNPDALGWINDMEAYRSLRVKQGWVSMAIREGDRDAKPMYEDLDRQRRGYHNKALTAFCRLVEATSSKLSNRANQAPRDGSYYIPRNESDLYSGPLMIPYEEPDGYGNHAVRMEMTDGMFQLLKFIEETHRSDWDIARQKVLARKRNVVKQQGAPEPEIEDIQRTLRSNMRAWGVDDSPEIDDFGLDIYDKRDRRNSDDFGEF